MHVYFMLDIENILINFSTFIATNSKYSKILENVKTETQSVWNRRIL